MMAFHFQAEGDKSTGCGRVGAKYTTSIFTDVDCGVCRRSVLFKLAKRQQECGAVTLGDYALIRCELPKGHEGEHAYQEIE
jgi:hypothetical protein